MNALGALVPYCDCNIHLSITCLEVLNSALRFLLLSPRRRNSEEAGGCSARRVTALANISYVKAIFHTKAQILQETSTFSSTLLF